MQTYSLLEQKKELQNLMPAELIDLCLRLARFKKENKELLEYLLFHQSNPMPYVELIKKEIENGFGALTGANYTDSKKLRKMTKLLNKQAKYVQNSDIEVDLYLCFCTHFCHAICATSSAKVVQNFFLKAVLKIEKLSHKLHEDLAFDVQQELNNIHKLASEKMAWYPLPL